ncbi:hypothetical protein [Desulforamulus reducens]|uniref:hypothetical protein n=1 Tax=Desulforamulus reducens TaxID=59610 RepID=UPI0002D9E432|nr:hypothetical protein [Desulforamulus reducens]
MPGLSRVEAAAGKWRKFLLTGPQRPALIRLIKIFRAALDSPGIAAAPGTTLALVLAACSPPKPIGAEKSTVTTEVWRRKQRQRRSIMEKAGDDRCPLQREGDRGWVFR